MEELTLMDLTCTQPNRQTHTFKQRSTQTILRFGFVSFLIWILDHFLELTAFNYFEICPKTFQDRTFWSFEKTVKAKGIENRARWPEVENDTTFTASWNICSRNTLEPDMQIRQSMNGYQISIGTLILQF